MLRVVILSTILFFLIVYLGIRYHWGDLLNSEVSSTLDFQLPERKHSHPSNLIKNNQENFQNAQIVEGMDYAEVVYLMSKNQIKQHCDDLLSKTITDPAALLIATGNCVLSNYQEKSDKSKPYNFRKSDNAEYVRCSQQYQQHNGYSRLEKQLLIGMCVSDLGAN